MQDVTPSLLAEALDVYKQRYGKTGNIILEKLDEIIKELKEK